MFGVRGRSYSGSRSLWYTRGLASSIGKRSNLVHRIRGKEKAEPKAPPHDFPAVTYSPVTPSVTVPSALEGLTAVFGMGTGVAPPL